MQAKLNELQAKASQAETSAEHQFFTKVADSVQQSIADVMGIGDYNERKKAMNQMKRQCHPDKNPAALSWLFTEIFKYF